MFSRTARVLPLLLLTVAQADPPKPGRFDFYERFVAIDGACAWPNLNRLPDGKLAVLIWPYNNHGITEGAAECWISDDGARWRKSSVPVSHQPGTNRMNVAAGVVDEKFLALVGGWDRRVPYQPGPSQGPVTHLEGAVTITPISAVSGDSGKTWRQFPELPLPKRSDGKSLVPFGRIGKLNDGEYGVCLYGGAAHFYTTADGGATWIRRGTIMDQPTHNETTWVQLANGDLFAAARTAREGRLDGFRSTDGGRTWMLEGPLTLARQHPADLLKLPDGHVLLTYASRNAGLYAIWVQMGSPDLKAWSGPMMLVDLEGSSEFQRTPPPSSDGGYPSTVQTGDGTFTTAYYTRGVSAHQRYHMGVVRWRPTKSAFLLTP